MALSGPRGVARVVTEDELVELAARTAELCEMDKAGPLVFRDPDTGRWMVDEGYGSADDGRLYVLPPAGGGWVVDSPVLVPYLARLGGRSVLAAA